jgi:uncharacterized protein YndB with AHSA1/START domain
LQEDWDDLLSPGYGFRNEMFRKRTSVLVQTRDELSGLHDGYKNNIPEGSRSPLRTPSQPEAGESHASRFLTATRAEEAPREFVFAEWTDPKQVAQWWGPNGFSTTIQEMDVKQSGVFRFDMRGPDGKDYPFDGAYVENVEPARIVFRGNIHDVPGQDVLTTVTFAEHEGKTNLTVHQVYAMESDATRGAPVGWSQTLDRLEEYVAKA